jgi:hypothetical protein
MGSEEFFPKMTILHALANIWWKFDENRIDFERFSTKRQKGCPVTLNISYKYFKTWICHVQNSYCW